MNRQEYKAKLIALYNKPPGPNKENQKFKRGFRIKVTENLPDSMSHFEKGFEGIVKYTHAQQFGGENIDSYSILQLNKAGKPINSISWYKENQLTLINENIKEGLALIEEYKRGR